MPHQLPLLKPYSPVLTMEPLSAIVVTGTYPLHSWSPRLLPLMVKLSTISAPGSKPASWCKST